jgi:N-acetylneuraminic acid mutarotase
MSEGTWLAPRAPLPTARYMLGLAALQGQLHAIGGHAPNSDAAAATHEAYDRSTNQWSAQAAMPTARYALGVAVVGNQLYAIGGFGLAPGSLRTPLATNEMYDPVTGRWTARAPMPTARGEVAVGVIGGKIYVVGGQVVDCVAVNEVYDPVSDSWSTGVELSAPRSGIAGAVVDDVLFLCGGAGDDEVVLSTVEAYYPATGSYTAMASMPTARWLAGAAVAQGQVFVLGGSSFSTEAPLAANESYDPLANAWTSQDPIPGIGPADWSAATAAISKPTAGHVYVLNGIASPQTHEYLTSAFDGREEPILAAARRFVGADDV